MMTNEEFDKIWAEKRKTLEEIKQKSIDDPEMFSRLVDIANNADELYRTILESRN